MGSSIGAIVFGACVLIVTVGVLWFHIVRPILEDFGVIRVPESVNPSQPIMSPQEPTRSTDRPSSRAGSQWVEPAKIADTSQLEPDDPSVREPPDDPIVISHNMSRKELTIVLAAQKDGEGAYRFSANKIAEFVGGTSAEVKGWVADVRGKKEPAASTLRRPANGWGKSA